MIKNINILFFIIFFMFFAYAGSSAQENIGQGEAASVQFGPVPVEEEIPLMQLDESVGLPEVKSPIVRGANNEELKNEIDNIEKEINSLKKWGIGIAAASGISLFLALYSLIKLKKSF